MRFNDLLHLVAFPCKAHGKPPAPGFVTATKMPESCALSKFSDHFSRYIPLSAAPPLQLVRVHSQRIALFILREMDTAIGQ